MGFFLCYNPNVVTKKHANPFAVGAAKADGYGAAVF